MEKPLRNPDWGLWWKFTGWRKVVDPVLYVRYVGAIRLSLLRKKEIRLEANQTLPFRLMTFLVSTFWRHSYSFSSSLECWGWRQTCLGLAGQQARDPFLSKQVVLWPTHLHTPTHKRYYFESTTKLLALLHLAYHLCS